MSGYQHSTTTEVYSSPISSLTMKSGSSLSDTANDSISNNAITILPSIQKVENISQSYLNDYFSEEDDIDNIQNDLDMTYSTTILETILISMNPFHFFHRNSNKRYDTYEYIPVGTSITFPSHMQPYSMK